jgi:hypothetical protein
VAIYRLALSTVSRGAGRSAIAAAAYRAGARLRDVRTGRTHDYRRRAGVVRTALIGWRGTRAALWQAAEAAERRRDAVVAREVQLALPHELAPALRWALATDMATWLHTRYGVAVDLAVHRPHPAGDDRNHHAHLLFTTRAVAPAGTFGAKTTVLDHRRTGSAELEVMRAHWAALVNAALARAGRPERVDHRSYIRQGRPRESEHLTRGARELEARGAATDRGDAQRARRRRNRTRLPRAVPSAHPAPAPVAPTPRRRLLR